MTDRERKDYYLKRIEKVLANSKRRIMMYRAGGIPIKWALKDLEEELKIIQWNNSELWADTFMNEEVIPLLRRHGLKI